MPRKNPSSEKTREYRRRWYHKNKDKARAWQLKHMFGLTLEEYQKLYDAQNGCCAICGANEETLKSVLHVDHNHETEFVRGLLCQTCNMGLGLFKDDIGLLRKAQKYLELEVPND